MLNNNFTVKKKNIFVIFASLKLKHVHDLQDYALKVITETNESWAKLVKRSASAGELSLV